MDNKIDISFINKQKQLNNNIDDISNKIGNIDIKTITKNIENNIEKTKEEIEVIFNSLKINYQNKKKVLTDNNNIDRTSYEYRSKYLKRKLSETEFYSILRKQNKYY